MLSVAEEENRLALNQFYKCPFYWGRINRKTAEAILEDQPNGSYLLKDPEEEEDEKKWLLELAIKVNSKLYHCQMRLRRPIWGGKENYLLLSFETLTPHKMGAIIHYASLSKVDSKINYLGTFMKILKDKNPYGILCDSKHPILRNNPFSLLELARNEITNTGIRDEDISKLKIPKPVKKILKGH